jgi:hypothetical protein
MPALLDIALAVLVLAGAFLLFGVARQLIQGNSSSKNDNQDPPAAK